MKICEFSLAKFQFLVPDSSPFKKKNQNLHVGDVDLRLTVVDLSLIDCRSVVMNVIEIKQENLFNKQCIGNPQYLNSKRRESYKGR